jgi:hypothetical protein
MVAAVSKPEQILGERRGLALLDTTESGRNYRLQATATRGGTGVPQLSG